MARRTGIIQLPGRTETGVYSNRVMCPEHGNIGRFVQKNKYTIHNITKNMEKGKRDRRHNRNYHEIGNSQNRNKSCEIGNVHAKYARAL